jgi:hypothetical protein
MFGTTKRWATITNGLWNIIANPIATSVNCVRKNKKNIGVGDTATGMGRTSIIK